MNIENKCVDKEYLFIVKDILEHEEFCKTKEIIHHGMNRFDHCMRVSYYSYKICKLLKLDYGDVARAGMLHDFFLVDNSDVDATKRIDVLINHPKYALANAKRCFELNEKEEDIITSHMFPVALKAPRYMESWIVNVVDNFIAIVEAGYAISKQLGVAVNFLLLVILNYWR